MGLYINSIRFIRDSGQEVVKTTEKVVGIPLKAKVFDQHFIVEEFISGLNAPILMEFVGNDILILEKNSGHVNLIQNGVLQSEPLLDFDVAHTNESGLLGITNNENQVFIFVTETDKDGTKTIGNNIYSYTWTGSELTNKKLENSLSSESSWHNGGAMTTNSDGQVFAVIGDQFGGNRTGLKNDYRILQNVMHGDVDDSGVIVKVGINSEITQPKLSENPFEHYYGIGIRNSFGLAFDPITDKLWNSENGPDSYDEINLVNENFNSGWIPVMGPASEEQISKIPKLDPFEYSDPEFSWERPVVPTGITFVTSNDFSKYENDLLVGSCLGYLFKFQLAGDRNGFVFNSPHLQDLVANYIELDNGKMGFESMDEILFGEGFGCITDIEFGPDGYLYVVSISDNAIYRILPKSN